MSPYTPFRTTVMDSLSIDPHVHDCYTVEHRNGTIQMDPFPSLYPRFPLPGSLWQFLKGVLHNQPPDKAIVSLDIGKDNMVQLPYLRFLFVSPLHVMQSGGARN